MFILIDFIALPSIPLRKGSYLQAAQFGLLLRVLLSLEI